MALHPSTLAAADELDGPMPLTGAVRRSVLAQIAHYG